MISTLSYKLCGVWNKAALPLKSVGEKSPYINYDFLYTAPMSTSFQAYFHFTAVVDIFVGLLE